MTGKITLQCLGRGKHRKVLAADQMPTDQPMCDKCPMPMVIVAAKLTSRRSGVDLRKVIK